MEHKMNFLGITIDREPNKMSIDIYRKLTYTDVIIPNVSCHPREHKMAVIHYLYNRRNTYQLSPEKRQKESISIQQILKNNGYNTTILQYYNLRKYIQKRKTKGRQKQNTVG
jgi:hypothetical protein